MPFNHLKRPMSPEEAEVPLSPFDLPGDWYVIHSYSGYENKVKVNLETRIQSMHMENRIFEVHIPLEESSRSRTARRSPSPARFSRVHPGADASSTTTPGTRSGTRPGSPASSAATTSRPPSRRREVERFLGVQKEERKGQAPVQAGLGGRRDRAGG